MLVSPTAGGEAGSRSPGPAWHAMEADIVLTELGTTVRGLPQAEAAARLTRSGPNRIPMSAGVSALSLLGKQLRSVVVLLLVAAAILSFVVGDRLEAAAIGAVLVVNALVGFGTEWRARRAMEALLGLEAARALVIRGGRLLVVSAETLVPGDIVQLDAGNKVPADVRVLTAADLATDEAALTGESLPVGKEPDVLPATTLVADRLNMAFMGTSVVTGTGLAAVTATGAATELGRIGVLVSTIVEEPTPLERRLDMLGRRLAWLTIIVAALVSALGLVHGLAWGLMLQTGIALAVAAMPEALPAVATIALAVGMRRMVRRHALVRRLPSVETLGSTTVVCTDKTRTLTSGEMTVVRVWSGFGDFERSEADATLEWEPAAARVLEHAALACQAPAGASGPDVGNPVDVAILATVPHIGTNFEEWLTGHPRRGLLPFSSARKLMASFHGHEARLTAYVKGAPAAVLGISEWMVTPAGLRALDARLRAELMARNETLARTGLRLLAVASGDVTEASEEALHGLVFAGFIGLADPVAPGVASTVALLRQAGLRTIMITGDQRATAEAVGRAVGLIEGDAQVVDGLELTRMTSGELAARVADVNVFSRVSPEHKLLIVRALQERGDIVAMLGDGVNDAPALRQAEVGVAMGVRGTDVAKQAAAIVLQDDRLQTVAAAVEEGRIIFDNIRKFVFYLFSCNVAEILVLLTASVSGLPVPLEPLQLLWLNMVTDTFPALALAVEPGEAGVMRRSPRHPREAILSRAFVFEVFLYAAAITTSTLAAFWWALRAVPEHASTMAFMTLALAQIGHLGNARSQRAVLAPARAVANRFALAAVALAVSLQLWTTFEPLAEILNVSGLRLTEWLIVIGCAVFPAALGQTLKVACTSAASAR